MCSKLIGQTGEYFVASAYTCVLCFLSTCRVEYTYILLCSNLLLSLEQKKEGKTTFCRHVTHDGHLK